MVRDSNNWDVEVSTMKRKNLPIEILGWYGTVAIIGSYFLVILGYLSSKALSFELLNITGATGLLVLSVYKKAYPPAALYAAWTLIGIATLIF